MLQTAKIVSIMSLALQKFLFIKQKLWDANINSFAETFIGSNVYCNDSYIFCRYAVELK